MSEAPVKRGRGQPRKPPSTRLPRKVDAMDAEWFAFEQERSGLTSRALFARMVGAYCAKYPDAWQRKESER